MWWMTGVEWKSWVAIMAFTAALFSPVLAVGAERGRTTLVGITGVKVVIEDLDPYAEREGLTKPALQSDVELKLRQAGIRILTESEQLATPGMPYLYLRLSTRRNETGFYVIRINLKLFQAVRHTRHPTVIAFTTTWEAPAWFGIYGEGILPKVQGVVRDMVDGFINAYLAANPKR